MKNKILTLLWLLPCSQIYGQGFINLNFEQANNPGSFYASNAIPGWTAYIGGVAQTYISYNAESLGAAAINLEGTNNSVGFNPIQGKYFVFLQSSTPGPFVGQSAAIGQTAQIPASAQSMTFFGYILSGIVLTFGGQNVSYNQTGSTANYDIYTADISAFAGQTGELLFTAPFNNSPGGTFGGIDNIQFSSTPVPEPGALALAALGGWLLTWRRRAT